MGLKWLRSQFPEFRFHQLIETNDYTRHADEALIPLRGPTPGSPGIVLLHQKFNVIEENLKMFKENDWEIITLPPIQTEKHFCLP